METWSLNTVYAVVYFVRKQYYLKLVYLKFTFP